tara:strand:- start:490 stop:1032 length:543 start_codon:yes stop_codon:yes gene_type:complete
MVALFNPVNLIPTQAVDVVGVYDEEFNQLFEKGRPVKASIKEDATYFKHPLENSETRTDHVVFNPVEIRLEVALTGSEYRNVFQQIKVLFKEQTQLIVQTKTDTYENMYLQGIPHEEDADKFEGVMMSLSLSETLLAPTEEVFEPSADADTSTTNRGRQEPDAPNESEQQRGSTLSRLFS